MHPPLFQPFASSENTVRFCAQENIAVTGKGDRFTEAGTTGPDSGLSDCKPDDQATKTLVENLRTNLDQAVAGTGLQVRLDEAVDLCRRCHRMAPFCFYNGNTFASIIALVIKKLALPADQAFVIRSLAGHIVAGVATDEEVKAFREFSDSLG